MNVKVQRKGDAKAMVAEFEEEKLKVVTRFDLWAMESSPNFDWEMESIYSKVPKAKGWRSIQKHFPEIFEEAYELARVNLYMLT